MLKIEIVLTTRRTKPETKFAGDVLVVTCQHLVEVLDVLDLLGVGDYSVEMVTEELVRTV